MAEVQPQQRDWQRQRIIGVTGGIATGKTLLASYLADRHGLPILDADPIARAIVASPPIVAALVHRYGPAILHGDGTVNRAQLAEWIFTKATEREWLNGLVHPPVRDRLLRETENLAPQTVVLVVPLLFEAAMTDLVTEIWVVTCTAAQQLSRLMLRDGLSPFQAQQRIDSQWPLSQKIALADVVLGNGQAPEHLFAQADHAYTQPPKVSD
jgi:dephospho-CoA kinase